MLIFPIPQDAPFFIGLILFNALVLLVCHIFRGRLTLGPLFASAGAMTLLFWQIRHLGWWLQWDALVIDTAANAFIPPLLMGLVFCYAFDGTRAARSYWSILIFTSLLGWGFAEFRDSLAHFVPIPYVFYLPTQSHAATLFALFMGAASALLSYAVFRKPLHSFAFTMSMLMGAVTFVLVDSLVQYGAALGWQHSLDVLPGFLLFSLIPAVFSCGYYICAQIMGMYMPIRSPQDILFFWRAADSNPFSSNQDFLESDRIISDLRQLNNKLQETQRIHDYQVLLNPLAILTTDTKGLIKSANPAAEALFNLSSEQLLQTSVLPYLQGLSLPQLCSEASLQTLPFVTKQNEERWHEYIATPIYDAYHKVDGYQLIIKDVTDFKRREFKQSIEHKVRNIHRTGKMFSHDISNLFLGIQGGLSQIKALFPSQEDNALFSAACDQISAALSQGRMMMSHLSNSQTLGSPQLSVCQLTDAIKEAINITKSRAKEDQVSIDFKRLANPLVNADAAQISRVLTNLISNATRASSPGNSITITLENSGSGVKICVIDQGKGMTEAQLSHAFDPGFSSKGAGQGGLGLAISYLSIEAHGGLLRLLLNENGVGMTAEIWLPCATQSSPSTLRGKRTLLALPEDSQLADFFSAKLNQLECDWVESQGMDEFQAVLPEQWDVLLIHHAIFASCSIESIAIPSIILINEDLSLKTLRGEDILTLWESR